MCIFNMETTTYCTGLVLLLAAVTKGCCCNCTEGICHYLDRGTTLVCGNETWIIQSACRPADIAVVVGVGLGVLTTFIVLFGVSGLIILHRKKGHSHLKRRNRKKICASLNEIFSSGMTGAKGSKGEEKEVKSEDAEPPVDTILTTDCVAYTATVPIPAESIEVHKYEQVSL